MNPVSRLLFYGTDWQPGKYHAYVSEAQARELLEAARPGASAPSAPVVRKLKNVLLQHELDELHYMRKAQEYSPTWTGALASGLVGLGVPTLVGTAVGHGAARRLPGKSRSALMSALAAGSLAAGLLDAFNAPGRVRYHVDKRLGRTDIPMPIPAVGHMDPAVLLREVNQSLVNRQVFEAMRNIRGQTGELSALRAVGVDYGSPVKITDDLRERLWNELTGVGMMRHTLFPVGEIGG